MKSLHQVEDGTLSLHPHPGQLRARESQWRVVFITPVPGVWHVAAARVALTFLGV